MFLYKLIASFIVMTKQNMLNKLIGQFPNSKIEVVDITGQSNHFSLFILSKVFKPISLIDRHKLIYSVFKKELTNEIHALEIKAFTPDEWKRKNNKNTPNKY